MTQSWSNSVDFWILTHPQKNPSNSIFSTKRSSFSKIKLEWAALLKIIKKTMILPFWSMAFKSKVSRVFVVKWFKVKWYYLECNASRWHQGEERMLYKSHKGWTIIFTMLTNSQVSLCFLFTFCHIKLGSSHHWSRFSFIFQTKIKTWKI